MAPRPKVKRKIHIRRPSTDRSFCDQVDASEPSKNIVDLEDRERSTCKRCRLDFGRIMYSPKTYNPRFYFNRWKSPRD